ncbi:MAG: hypothetical protein R3F43_00025 [bacterium]
MFVTTDGVKQTAYNEARLVKAFRSEDTSSVAALSTGDDPFYVNLHLRYNRRYETRYQEVQHVELRTPVVRADDPRILRFLHVACAAYPVVHGGVFEAATSGHAGAEAVLVGNDMISDDTRKRIHFDAMQESEALHKLRRLYPVTIIGPAIWASLPPLPVVDPPLVVRDLADCKMVTAWPTLTDPHDLAFLLGTRDLRAWLWPHTIQNPADDPAEVDIRLKWAELLPW